MNPYRSIARWPKGVGINLGNPHNESDDTHPTLAHAAAICRRLEREGFGGNGVIFPLSVRVEEVLPEDSWKTEARPLVVLEGIELGNRFITTRGNEARDPRLSAKGEVWYRVIGYAETQEEAEMLLYPTLRESRKAEARWLADFARKMAGAISAD
jgi:hypothetical protein